MLIELTFNCKKKKKKKTFVYCVPRTGFPGVGNDVKAGDIAKRRKEKVGNG